jgi:hypothetical protein
MAEAEPATRHCDKCGQDDTDPHHVQYVGFIHPTTGEPVDLSVTKHVDCCAEDGCGTCTATMAAANEAGVGKGNDLRKFLTTSTKEA